MYTALLLLLLLLASGTGAFGATQPTAQGGTPSNSNPDSNSSNNDTGTRTTTTTSSSRNETTFRSGLLSRFAEGILQRLQLTLLPSRPGSGEQNQTSDGRSSQSSPEELPDFASTANALTEQAVKEANIRAAALAQQAAFEANVSNSSSAGSDTTADVAAVQLLELQQQTANASSNSNSDSNSSAAGQSGLQLLLGTIRQQWAVSRNRQQQQSRQQQGAEGSQPSPQDAGEQWVSALDSMAAKYPSLSAFARLARNNGALVVSSSCKT